MPIKRRTKKRRFPHAAHCVKIGTLIQQETSHIKVTSICSKHESSEIILIACLNIQATVEK